MNDSLRREIERLRAGQDWQRGEIERLRANQERMWCKSCGTVTRNGECDCTCTESATQNLVNYADSLNDDARALSASNAQMLEALKDIVKRNEIQHWFNLDLARAAIAKAEGIKK
jgi:hypothetical protein